jgi:hypothetical protein
MNVKNPLVLLLSILGISPFGTEYPINDHCLCNGYFSDFPAAGNADRQCGYKAKNYS